MKDGIPYKGLTAMPGSTLHTLLSEAASAKTPQLRQELQKKAQQCYTATDQRYKRSIGELQFHGWELNA